MYFGCFFAPQTVASKMNRGVSNNSVNRSFITKNLQTSSPTGGGIAPTHSIEVKKAIFVYVFNHVADFVSVRFQHNDLVRLPF